MFKKGDLVLIKKHNRLGVFLRKESEYDNVIFYQGEEYLFINQDIEVVDV